MNTLYCPDCGTKMSYGSKKPNFCMGCGYSFDKSVGASVKPNSSEGVSPEGGSTVTSTDDNQLSGEYNSMEGLEVDYIGPAYTGTKIGELAGTLPGDYQPLGKQKKKGRRPSKKKIFEDFQKEAGAIKPQRNKED